MNDEIEIELVGRLKDVAPLPAEAFERARSVLRAAMAAANPGPPPPPPAPAPPRPAPAPARPGRRARTLATWSTAALGIAAAATALTLITTPSSQPGSSARHPLATGPAGPGRGVDPAPTAGSLPGQAPGRQAPQPPHGNPGQPSYGWTPFNRLDGVAAVSAHDVWAVGSAATGSPLIERWNGRAWTQAPAASPRGAQESLLNSVAAAGPAQAWAVGYYTTGQTTRTLIERWNGRAWKQVTSPSPGGVHGSFLLGVAAAGPSRAWAVGYYLTGQTTRTLIERWNGRAWKQVASPSPGGSHTGSSLSGVAAAGKSGAWAVGYYLGPPVRSLIERWNGRAWKFVASPNPGGHGGTLNAVTTVGDSGAWAAGSMATRTVDEALIERWNGRAWKPVASPRPAGSRGSDLTAITARSPASAWAVGYYFADAHVDPAVLTLIERWNGRAWQQEPSPSPGGSAVSGPDQSLLEAVAAVSPSQAWAAGSYSSGSPRGKVLLERRTGGAWSQVPAAHQ
jgi:hypothetical protein